MKVLPAIVLATALCAAPASWAEDTGDTSSRQLAAECAEALEASREAGLLTDWHMEGRFGHGAAAEIQHRYPPEKLALKLATSRGQVRSLHKQHAQHYELVFSSGAFELPAEQKEQKGVFYASSVTYLMIGGEWNLYLESGDAAVIFLDGRPVLSRTPEAVGVVRKAVRAESGYHSIMVKFVAAAAPFRVAILPPNSGSHHKNSTPYLRAVPSSEEMMARVAP